MMKILQVFLLVLISFLVNIALSYAERPLRVATTLSTFADLVKTIGGDYVEVTYIASPKFNAHFIEPKPSDVMKVKKADLFAHAGLDLELWRDPLLTAAGTTRVMPGGPGELSLSTGIKLLEVPTQMPSRAEGDIHIYGNPHYWLDPENGKQMANAIAGKLSAVDPEHSGIYGQRLNDFHRQLNQKIAGWKKRTEAIHGKEAVAYHNEWIYLTDFLGIQVNQFLEPKPGIPPIPKHIEKVEQYMLGKGIKTIILATFEPARAAESIASRTGASVVLLCQNVGEVPEAADYVAMMEYNVMKLSKVLE